MIPCLNNNNIIKEVKNIQIRPVKDIRMMRKKRKEEKRERKISMPSLARKKNRERNYGTGTLELS